MAQRAIDPLENLAGSRVDQVTAIQERELVPGSSRVFVVGECEQVNLERSESQGRTLFARVAGVAAAAGPGLVVVIA